MAEIIVLGLKGKLNVYCFAIGERGKNIVELTKKN